MNATKVIHELKLRQELIKQGITFHIKREVNNGRIVKTIAFEAKGQSYFFQEKVQALRLSDFQELLQQAGFEIQTTFGSYELDPFNEQTSDRLILICRTK
jgi:F0F1-type ATP synthase gamma subunit